MTTQTKLSPEKKAAIERYFAVAQDKDSAYEDVLRAYIENLFLVPHRDTAQRVPMVFTPAQDRYWKRKTARDVVTKARQVAFSSIVNAWFCSDIWHTRGLWALLVTQKPEEKQIPQHQARMRLFWNSVPEGLKPRWVKENHDHWEWAFECQSGCYKAHDFPCGNVPTSHFWFGASGSLELAQGGTYHRIHCTEVSGYERTEAETLRENLAGAPESSIIVWESRPNGVDNVQYELYQEAKARSGVYTAHFLPWFLEPGYTMPRAILGREPVFTEHEARLMQAHGLTHEQIAWRRVKIKDIGSETRFLEQFCEDDESCFLLTGSQVFDAEYLQSLTFLAKNPLRQRGSFRMYMPPKPGALYVIGGDAAKGLTTSNDTAAVVRNAETLEHVATVQGKINPEDFAGVLAEVGGMYNDALINPERKEHGYEVISTLVHKHEYPHVYKHLPHYVGGDDTLGFPTSGVTKPWIVGVVKDLVATHTWTSPDAQLILQMRQYAEVDINKFEGKMDDLVMADLMCWAAIGQALLLRPRRRSVLDKSPVLQAGW